MHIKTDLEMEDFKDMEMLEKRWYAADYITPAEEAYKWYKKFPYTTIAIYRDDELAGFLNLFPVKDYIYEKIQKGEFNDRLLKVEDIHDINEGTEFNMFLSCIVVAPFYQERGMGNQLLKEGAKAYEHVAHLCKNVITDNVTKEGESLSKRYGMKFCCDTDHNSKVYMAKYEDFLANL